VNSHGCLGERSGVEKKVPEEINEVVQKQRFEGMWFRIQMHKR